MGQLRDRMQQDLKRAAYGETTRRIYLREAQQFAAYFRRSPAEMGHRELREYVEHLEARGRSAQRLRGQLAALKFLYTRTLGRPEEVAFLAFPRNKRSLPTVLSGTEVQRVLAAVKDPTCHALASTLYGAGLRIEEARRLEVIDVLSSRGLLHVRHGKGGVERFAMLSDRLLHTLREYWRAARPKPPNLFASRHCDGAISPGTVRIALRRAASDAGVEKNVTPHVLRHSFATHLLELGVEMRVIQQLLGHASIRTTMRYTHVSREHVARIKSPLDLLGTPQAEILR